MCCLWRSSREHRAEDGKGVGMNNNLTLTRAQAGALARLIQSQLDAYDEAAHVGRRRKPARPFTASDLDLLEPLVAFLGKRRQSGRIVKL